MTKGGALKSVLSVIADELEINGGRYTLQQGPAIKVRGYTTSNIGARKVKGGDTQPIYVLTENDIRANGGRWRVVAGQAIQVTNVVGDVRGIIQGTAIPVFPVDDNGNFDSNFPITWLLRDDFITALAAGAINGTLAEPGPGTRTVVDTGNNISIAAGALTVAGGAAPWGDPHLVYGAQTRSAGSILVVQINAAVQNVWAGWNDDNNPGLPTGGTGIELSGNRFYIMDEVVEMFVAASAINTDYFLSVPLRATGAFYFVEGGIYPTWTLIWVSSNTNRATLFPSITNHTGVYTDDFIRIPDALWLPSPPASDGFGDPNGTSLDAHATDGLGHAEGVAEGIGSGGNGLAWIERNGNFDIQTNRANISVASGARDVSTVPSTSDDVFVDVTIRKTNAVDAGEIGACLRYTDNNNFWMVHADLGANQIEIVERNAAVETLRGSAAIALTFGTDYDVRGIAYGQTIDAYLDGGNRATYALAALNENIDIHGIVGNGTSETFDDFVIRPRTSSDYDNELDLYIQP